MKMAVTEATVSFLKLLKPTSKPGYSSVLKDICTLIGTMLGIKLYVYHSYHSGGNHIDVNQLPHPLRWHQSKVLWVVIVDGNMVHCMRGYIKYHLSKLCFTALST